MLIKAEINSKYKEMELHVCSDEVSDTVRDVMSELRTLYISSVTGTDEKGNKVVIAPANILTFYSEGQKVKALGKDISYTVSKKLYELEEELGQSCFVRISKSEIINYKKVQKLDMSVTGTIRVIMVGGYETYTSRRNVTKLKELILKDRNR